MAPKRLTARLRVAAPFHLSGTPGVIGALFETFELAFDPDCWTLGAAAGRLHVEFILAAAEFAGLRFILGHETCESRSRVFPIIVGSHCSNEFSVACVCCVQALLQVLDLARDTQPFGQEIGVAEDLIAQPVFAGEDPGRLVKAKGLAFARQVREDAAGDGVFDLGLNQLFVAHI